MKTLIHNIQDYYEAYRIVVGLIIALFDLIDNGFDDNLERSYYGNCFNTDKGFYSNREICENGKPKKDTFTRKTLKKYFEIYDFNDLQSFYEFLISEIKQVRLTGSHHLFLIEQDDDQLKKGICKIKYKNNIEEYHIGYLMDCQTLLYSYFGLIMGIAKYYFFQNV